MGLIDYKSELEAAAKSMILVHHPGMLIKMMVRMLVNKVRLHHAGILLYNKDRNTYILTISRGQRGLKIPAGYARVEPSAGLVRFFSSKNTHFKDSVLTVERINAYLRKKEISQNQSLAEILVEAKRQMSDFGAVTAIPIFFQQDLLGVMLFGKKRSGKKFLKEELNFFVALSSNVAMAIRNAQLFEDLAIEVERNHRLFIHTAMALASAIDAKDHYTHGHTQRVTDYCLAIARRLIMQKVLKPKEGFLENLRTSGLLHDIGKIGVPEAILGKEQKLTDDEITKVKQHSLIGVTILQPIKELAEPILGVRYHHENFDGTGYPEGKIAEDIPIFARIIRVADAYDAMTSDRPYRKAFTKHEAVEELKKYAGTQFDPAIVDAVVELFHEGNI
ncbi:MAG: HD domain-containing phosphohydrolase [Candidatus Omnitrophota bacterium]